MNKLLILFALITAVILVEAQQAEYYSFTLKQNTPLRASIYYKALVNTGDNTNINVDSIVFHEIENIANKIYKGNEKANNAIVWLLSPLFSITETESMADVIVSGVFHLEKNTESVEKPLYETSSGYATPIPYFELQTTNKVELHIVFDYKYKDNTHKTDTLIVTNESKRKPNVKFKSIDELVSKCKKDLSHALFNEFDFIERNKHNYKFPKVKIKDKALKEEYANAKDLLT